eukprot:TRINITY_DN32068_c0_g1_i1.p1 TRINITY_DN32068_c0_g1~~TRINITY_DN32068_c0_g1_i1.p1  ORF type:complete len:221 (+),score=-39.59 TRINITY_DN32068_c0_g1_i1:2-664(+)
MDQVVNYLVEVGLVCGSYTVTAGTVPQRILDTSADNVTMYTVQSSTIRIRVLMCDSVTCVPSDDSASYTDVLLYVFPSFTYVQESLRLGGASILELMLKHVLVIHLVGVATTLMNSISYGVATATLGESETANAIAALSATEYRYMSSTRHTCHSDPVCMYHHSSNDPLLVLGTDYTFVVYIVYRHNLHPHNTLYILRNEDSVTTFQCSSSSTKGQILPQ